MAAHIDNITDDNIEDWRLAGKIAAQALEYGASLIKPGTKLVEVADSIEKKIHDLGGKIAFPAQISCDHIAAHYCPHPDDETVFDKQVVCLDVGVHVNGAIGDNALTIDLSGENDALVKASRDALNSAIELLRPGITLGEIGKKIQETITSAGFAPVKNLSGHGLNRFEIHTDPQIPNYDSGETFELQEGMFIAIEPFATTGRGMIKETGNPSIFDITQDKPIRNPTARQILRDLDSLNGLPFTTRWLTKKYPAFKVAFALREMQNNNIIHSYPPLVEVEKGLVSQAEHSLLITEDGCEVLTKS